MSLGESRPKLTVLFLCTGNTCRSPLVEVLARDRFAGSGVRFRSGGLHAYPGVPASLGSRSAAEARGLSLDEHRSRPLSRELLADVDWVIGMTRGHVALFKSRFHDFRGRLGLLSQPGVDLTESAPPADAEEVTDPFGESPEAYQVMADQVERLLQGWRDVFVPPDGRDEEAP
jgi:protein-tyrosine-phosphatase